MGNAVVDIVPAAHAANDELSPTWFAVGHSEGGQAVLFASRAASRHPDLPLAGTVAIAPSSHLELALPVIAAGGLPADVVYGLYLLVGLSVVDPSIDPAQLVGPAGAAVLDRVTTSDCLLDTLAELGGTDVTTVFDLPDDEMARLSELLGRVGDPDREPTVGPLLVVQGETDHDIPAAITAELVVRLRELGVDVTERVYPGLDHDRVLGPSVCETLTWMAEHGGPAPTDCVAAPTDMS
jgi:pimeloyl-ACP methyl ester carboxylesterase